MKNPLAGLCVLFSLCCLLLAAPGQAEEPAPAAQGEHQAEAGGVRARELQGDDLQQVLRLFARQAKISLIVGEAVKGNVSMRLENASAMDAIETVVHSNHLSMTKDDKGVYYVNVPDPAEAALTVIAKPETADRIAAYVHNLHAALVKQGFAPVEALQIVTAIDPGTVLAAFGKKPDPAPAK